MLAERYFVKSLHIATNKKGMTKNVQLIINEHS